MNTPQAIIGDSFSAELSNLRRDYPMNFAPYVGLSSMEDGMFVAHAGTDVLDQLRFMHELGFKSFEDNFMKLRPVAEQRTIARELERLDMQLATFVATFETTGPRGGILPHDSLTFSSNDPNDRRELLKAIEAAAEVAKRLGATWSTVLSGRIIQSLAREYQTANVIDNLKYAADIAERAGFTLGLENRSMPVRGRYLRDHRAARAPDRAGGRSPQRAHDLRHISRAD